MPALEPAARTARPLELFVRLEGAGGFQFGAQGLPAAEAAALCGPGFAKLDVLITRMPPELLNANYWEPLTKESENAVREKMVGLVTKSLGDQVLLWRSDRIARSRLLRDGIDAAVELLQGYIFRTTGEGLLKLGAAWSGRDRFEWAAIQDLPAPVPPQTLSSVHADLTQGRLSTPGEALLFSAQADSLVRLVLPRRAQLARAIDAALRSYLREATGGQHLGTINEKVCTQLAELADGLGLSSSPSRDVVDKGRTLEATFHLGRTPWGVSLQAGREGLVGDERLLLYYDKVNGLWAVSS
jgi:hypothetical protein